MVVIFLPAAAPTGVWQDRAALPSMCTVQEPQAPMPHPNLVPVSFRCSRITQRSGTSGPTSTWYALPLMSSEIIVPSFAGRPETDLNYSPRRHGEDQE